MESPEITEDYYNTLGVDQTATLELIIRSYRRLASEVRPRDGGYTPAYQPLALAYGTLRDEDKRREYDLIYPLIRQTPTDPPTTQRSRRSLAPPALQQPRVVSRSYKMSPEAHRNLRNAGVASMQARDAARKMEERAEIAIERTRRFREARGAARITSYGGTRQARASVCYYEGEWRKIDGGALCPQCLHVCMYQLSCPVCCTNTCSRCLKNCRLRFPHNQGKMARTALAKRREA